MQHEVVTAISHDENLNESINLEDCNTDDEREKWMFMAELNVEKFTDFNHSIIPQDGYWHKALQFFSKGCG